eukprot:Partr_v1_DN26363_c1_g1_i4_m43139 putative Ribonuclease P MRP 40kDa subunit
MNMLLSKNTYECLGLQGRRSAFVEDQFTVELNLRESSFGQDRKLYKRVQSCLQAFSTSPVSFTVSSIVGSDVEKMFTNAKCIDIAFDQSRVDDIQVPDFESLLNTQDSNEWEELAADALEWMGLVRCGADLALKMKHDPYVSVYSPPTPANSGYCQIVRISGLFGPDIVKRIIEDVVTLNSKKLPWIFADIAGSPDSPISVNRKERASGLARENSSSMLYIHDLQTDIVSEVMWRCVGAFDKSI